MSPRISWISAVVWFSFTFLSLISLYSLECLTPVLGTGIPLSSFCYSYYSCLFFIFFINPSICFVGAINKARIECRTKKSSSFGFFLSNLVKFYKQHLLHPDDWFSLWRLNCRLVSYHSHLTKAKGYQQEVQYQKILLGTTWCTIGLILYLIIS